jgi:hypothetical protein
MGSGRLAWSQLKGWERHQRLVAKSRTAERLHPHGYTFLNKRMLGVDT